MPVSHVSMAATSLDPVEVGLADAAELRRLFAQIPDPRKARGIRHTLSSVLTALVFAILVGAATYREAGDRIADLPPLLHEAAGTRARAGRFLAPSKDTVRRSARPGGKNVQLFSAMRHHEAVVIAQIRVPEDTTEITQVPALLDGVDLSRAVITGDAAHTQYDTAAYLRERDTHYILTVKNNQPALRHAVEAHFATPREPDHVTIERRSGTTHRRAIWIVKAPRIAFPGTKRVFKVLRERLGSLGQPVGHEITYGITSLTATQATPAQIATWVRSHWGIENKTH